MNPLAVFFTADTHFGHANILKHDGRPYATIESHDEDIIRRWNRLVGPRDTVYHLGDVAFRSERPASWYLNQLNGKIHLVRGNHDGGLDGAALSRFESVSDILEVKVAGKKMVLCHYGMRTWHGSNRGAWHLHGHSHGELPRISGTLDVGINVWGYRPVMFDFIRTVLADFKGANHHPRRGQEISK